MHLTRRSLFAGASVLAMAGPAVAAAPIRRAGRVEPIPTRFVRLKPSAFADASAANRRYLLALEPERLLHNFYVSAGLPAPRPVYGGWEAQGIAGHTLGHWLSACALVVASTGDRDVAARLDHALSEMARIQSVHGDGYCGGTTVERDGRTVDGKVVFEEVRRGDIRSQGFDLNGGWVPLYTWHKVHAGLLDAHTLAGNPRALPIALGVAGYLAGVLEPLTDAQMQQVLRAEHGGLNESYADTYALTGDTRWLRMAEKIRHKAVLDPLVSQQDRLAGLHANTQIPKVIGLARLYELTGDPRHATAARFFHQTVTQHHSYVLGGNSEREHFGEPDQLSHRLTDATCEACNSYNMLKLTRHLYSWHPEARWFDFYERVQLNHILAHQRPDTGRFVYFMPLSAGARAYLFRGGGQLLVLRRLGHGEPRQACGLDLLERRRDAVREPVHPVRTGLGAGRPGPDARYPAAGSRADAPDDPQGAAPGAGDRAAPARLGAGTGTDAQRPPADPTLRDGYAVVDRAWKAGDTLELTTPMALSVEPTPDDPSVVAFTNGPLVLAADLGPASGSFDGLGPALVTGGAAAAALRAGDAPHLFQARGALGEDLVLRPFFAQYDRRTAVYFPTFTPAGWAVARGDYVKAQEEAVALARRTIDIVHLGEMQPERDHGFAATRSEVVNWNGRAARRLRPGDTMRVMLARRPGPAMVRVTVWGHDVNRELNVTVDGTRLPIRRAERPREDRFVTIDYPLPSAGAQGKPRAEVAFTPVKEEAVLYEVRMLTAETGVPGDAGGLIARPPGDRHRPPRVSAASPAPRGSRWRIRGTSSRTACNVRDRTCRTRRRR